MRSKYLTAVFLSCFHPIGSAHDTLAENWEWVSERLPEVISGLEPYQIAHHLDLPLTLNWDLFNDQIIDTEIKECLLGASRKVGGKK